jgi:DNA-binding NtrC family response regulator
MKLPYRVLVLDDDEHALEGFVELLRDAGYNVTGASTFDSAKQLLTLEPFDLLITDVRLRGYNGLHLVMQVRAEYPDTEVIIISGYDEPLIELEASRHNAVFVRKPVMPSEFLKTVANALAHVRRQRRWPRKRVIGGFRVTVAGQPAAVVDVCYGGLRLEIASAASLPSTFDVEVAGIGLQLPVQSVWSYPTPDSQSVVCGAALASDSTPAAQTWRAIVDRLSA